jgi:hypothetical protein
MTSAVNLLRCLAAALLVLLPMAGVWSRTLMWSIALCFRPSEFIKNMLVTKWNNVQHSRSQRCFVHFAADDHKEPLLDEWQLFTKLQEIYLTLVSQATQTRPNPKTRRQ